MIGMSTFFNILNQIFKFHASLESLYWFNVILAFSGFIIYLANKSKEKASQLGHNHFISIEKTLFNVGSLITLITIVQFKHL